MARAAFLAALALAATLAMPAPAPAETLVAARTIRAQTVLAPGDVAVIEAMVPGALARPEEAIGLEARVALYEGRPIRAGDLGPPALVERNGRVTLLYRRGALSITAEGRALDRAGPGDSLRVINLDSRTTVTGRVAPDGRVLVGATPGS